MNVPSNESKIHPQSRTTDLQDVGGRMPFPWPVTESLETQKVDRAMSPRFRFRIRFLLGMVALAAVASAVVWRWWPSYLDYQDRKQFEQSTRALPAGATAWQVLETLGGTTISYSGDADDNSVAFLPFFRRSGWYCAYLELRDDSDETSLRKIPSSRICVYRLPTPDPDYTPQTNAGTRAFSQAEGDEAWRVAFTADIYEMLKGETTEDAELELEPVYLQPVGVAARPE